MVKHDSFGTTIFIWEGMRLIEERRGSSVISYVYEPGSYVPLARLDADGQVAEEGGLGTTADAAVADAIQNIATAAHQPLASGQNHSTPAANDAESRCREAEAHQTSPVEGWGTGTDGQMGRRAAASTEPAALCKVYYFHTDQVGMPQELTNAQGQLVWQASYKTWGATAAEEWEIKTLSGNSVHQLDVGDTPDQSDQHQNLRFQGQYLDRETGLHYNTFRYYDSDIGRFICQDPIGLDGGINLGRYSPNPLSWIDPWGWCIRTNAQNGKAHGDLVTTTAEGKYGAGNVQSEVYIRPLDANGNPVNYRVRVDNTVGTSGNKIPTKILEAKGSATAPLTPNQAKGYPHG